MMTDYKPPSEEEIVDLLQRVAPRPGPGFKHKMADPPWNRTRSIRHWTRYPALRVVATIGLIGLLFVGFSLFSPTLNTLAERLTQFFAPSPSSQTSIEIPPQETSNPLEGFNLSIAQAEALAGFKIKIPDTIPTGFIFTGAAYREIREAIILNYTTPSGKLVLRISQQRIGPDYQSIGPEAVVEKVQVGQNAGEYVSGGWMIPVPEVESTADATASPTLPQALWDASVKLQTLRWADDEFLYEIILAGGSEQPEYLDKDDLIALANHLH